MAFVAAKDTSNGNLSDYVSQHLINYIRTNQLRSGEMVPSEVRLSSELGISRGIVREAFRALKMTIRPLERSLGMQISP